MLRLKVIAAMQLTKQFIEGDGESVREAVEAKASVQTAISFTRSYMSKCSVSSNTWYGGQIFVRLQRWS